MTSKTSEKRFFRLSYSHRGERPRLFQDRDGAAAHEIADPLYKLGYSYGSLIYLYPSDERKLHSFPQLQQSDILLLTTRPPLDDHDDPDTDPHKAIPKNGSALEMSMFSALREYFLWCTRARVELQQTAIQLLKCSDAQKWAMISLRQNHPQQKSAAAMEIDALVKLHHLPHGKTEPPPPPPPYRTIAFLIRINNIPHIGCDLIASFGMDGYTTLLWNRIVRIRYAHLLKEPGFVMAELLLEDDIPARPLTPAFADDERKITVHLLT